MCDVREDFLDVLESGTAEVRCFNIEKLAIRRLPELQ